MPDSLKRAATSLITPNAAVPDAAVSSKRRRVSRACDTCRAAKERCNGIRPTCQRCTIMKRRCAYSTPEKRRGIRTGYLRTIELALAILLEQIPACEELLLSVLLRHEDGSGDFLLDGESAAGDGLLKKWQRSKVHQGVDRLISRQRSGPHEELDVSENELDVQISPNHNSQAINLGGLPSTAPADTMAGIGQRMSKRGDHGNEDDCVVIQLPTDFRRLLDIYFAYTHCWFPILERDKIMNLASSYPSDGLTLDPGAHSCAAHSELWSAMAVAAVRNPQAETCSGSNSRPDGRLNSKQIYRIARRLVPFEDATFHSSHSRSILLLSLVKLSKKECSAAWLLIGNAVRLLLQSKQDHIERQFTSADPDSLLFMACCVLDTLVSLNLGQPSHIRTADYPTALQRLQMPPEPLAGWEPIPGIGPCLNGDASSKQAAPSPVVCLYQLYKFCAVLSRNVEQPNSLDSSPAAADLVKALDPPFYFCNTLIHGGFSPRAPSAFLVQAGFLTSSMLLTPDSRPYLMGSLIDVVEACLNKFAACGSPLLLLLYLELASSNGRATGLQHGDRMRLEMALESLENRSGGDDTTAISHNESLTHSVRSGQSADTPFTTQVQPLAPPFGVQEAGPIDFNMHSRSYLDHGSNWVPAVANTLSSVIRAGHDVNILDPMLEKGLGRNIADMTTADSGAGGCAVDYDAILDELASLDYVDSMDPDPQFMANLGFGPGCETQDMLRWDFAGL
ncbi:hypothetical protein DL764_004540 [Monosporascus ibericus]|uniref:Zn(2)-C6 fungal-type domain-containing protein n=1 Tax=Monosporascus ibericus TaxID=155417 RepID=A0A4Q4TFR9_9PEZI|nr:hypothetical protein DL764_004540 [Monosporascus ibericus]